MNAGRMISKVFFFETKKIEDGAGGFDSSIVENCLLETLAEVKQIRATRTAENLQEKINSVFEIKIKMRACFEPIVDYTIRMRSEDFDIVSIDKNLEKRELTLIVSGRGSGVQG